MSTITHVTLAKVVGPGVAHLVYSHPIVQKTSLDFRNAKVIKPEYPYGMLVKLVVKMMPSGKRLLIGCTSWKGDSIQQFVDEFRTQLEFASKYTGNYDGIPAASKFDGLDDVKYQVGRSLPRFTDPKAVVNEEEKVRRPDDGYVEYGNLFIHKILISALDAITAIAQSEGAANLLLIGTSGNGKTSLAREYASQREMNYLKVNCSTVRDPEEWFGYREAKDGSTIFVETEFVKAVKAGNTVILLDEINRLEPYLHNSLMPLLDETRQTIVHGDEIKVGPNVVFMCTLNAGSGFVGTFTLDAALKNRMDATVIMPQLPAQREAELIKGRVDLDDGDIAKIVRNLSKIRDTVSKHQIEVDVSHRSALKIARILKTKTLNIREAFALVVFNNADSPEQAKLLADSLVE